MRKSRWDQNSYGTLTALCYSKIFILEGCECDESPVCSHPILLAGFLGQVFQCVGLGWTGLRWNLYLFTCIQTLHILPCFLHTHTLDEKIVGYTYTSGSYFSNMSCQTYRIYNLDQDLWIYRSGFLYFHSNNCYLSPAHPRFILYIWCMCMS